jgi:hypothetical protein
MSADASYIYCLLEFVCSVIWKLGCLEHGKTLPPYLLTVICAFSMRRGQSLMPAWVSVETSSSGKAKIVLRDIARDSNITLASFSLPSMRFDSHPDDRCHGPSCLYHGMLPSATAARVCIEC